MSEQDLQLTPAERERLDAAVARRPRGLFTDVDGTISPIAPTPGEAALLPGVRELLVEACTVFDLVAAISGRAALDARRLVGLPGLLYIGNHGMEYLDPNAAQEPDALRVLPAARRYVADVDRAVEQVEAGLRARFPEIMVERKGVTASIHYRNAADRAAAEAGILAALAEAAAGTELRVTRGKMVVELRPPIHADKGTTIEGMVREVGLAGAVFLGDDRTDIDGFRALRRLTAGGICAGASVAVLQPEAPLDLAEQADSALAGIAQVPALLRWLLERARAADRGK
jgi:trehalose 6-phosphate phosphatase